MEKTYVLYGSDLVNEMENENPDFKEISEKINDGDGILCEYDESTSISQILEDADGWLSNIIISESDYMMIKSFT